MDMEGRKRLFQLAEFLETVDEDRFDMQCWASSDTLNDPKWSSSACALGWATMLFPQDLQLVKDIDRDIWTVRHIPSGKVEFRAATEFFSIPFEVADELFGDDGNGQHDPQEKAAQIRVFIGD